MDGTIIEFLCGEKSFDGVWFGDTHPNEPAFGKFWWRPYLRKYIEQNSHKHGVMQAEGSDGAKEAAVASEGQGEAKSKCQLLPTHLVYMTVLSEHELNK